MTDMPGVPGVRAGSDAAGEALRVARGAATVRGGQAGPRAVVTQW
ncbi:hypothetical protein [Actinacidiphila acididurans]|nr:hypothetical protein [Actinacidiphila acididurans]